MCHDFVSRLYHKGHSAHSYKLSLSLLFAWIWMMLHTIITGETGGDYRFPQHLSLCPSVGLSVRPSVSPLGVRPLGFPNFSQLSFEILTWNLVYGFVLTSYRSSFTLVAFDLLLHELLPFAKISFSGLFFVIFRHIELKFHIWICLDIIQVRFDFGRVWPSFTWVIALC